MSQPSGMPARALHIELTPGLAPQQIRSAVLAIFTVDLPERFEIGSALLSALAAVGMRDLGSPSDKRHTLIALENARLRVETRVREARNATATDPEFGFFEREPLPARVLANRGPLGDVITVELRPATAAPWALALRAQRKPAVGRIVAAYVGFVLAAIAVVIALVVIA
jgi:hypothetical protein